MKRLVPFMTIAAAAAMLACGSDTTEIAWINSDQSAASINNIVWASGDQEWSKAGGYADSNEKTETREVSKLAGDVECDIDNGGGNFLPASIDTINGAPVNSLVLSEGSSEVFILKVSL